MRELSTDEANSHWKWLDSSLTNHIDRIILKWTWKPDQDNKKEPETYLSYAMQSGSNQEDGQIWRHHRRHA